MSSPHSTKARHYAALASGIRTLNTNLAETEELYGMLAQQLLYMRQLALTNGSQFMAASRLLDAELAEVTAQAEKQAQSSSHSP